MYNKLRRYHPAKMPYKKAKRLRILYKNQHFARVMFLRNIFYITINVDLNVFLV